MLELKTDELWLNYEAVSAAHKRSMELRLAAERELSREPSLERLTNWNAALREEDQCYEQLKAAEHVVWAKFKSKLSV